MPRAEGSHGLPESTIPFLISGVAALHSSLTAPISPPSLKMLFPMAVWGAVVLIPINMTDNNVE